MTETIPNPTAEQRRGDWIQTFTGRKFWPLDPRPEDIDVRDIAHALAHLCRFTGHSKTFYSVAQHCVIASEIVSPEAALPALLHDAAEAYMGDIARPWKRLLHCYAEGDACIEPIKLAEHRLLDIIVAALGCPSRLFPIWEEVEKADTILLVTEARDLMAPLAPGWHHTPENGFEILPDRISPWTPGRSEHAFLKRFTELTRAK